MIVGRDAFLFVEEPDKVADLVSVDQNKLVRLTIEKNSGLANISKIARWTHANGEIIS